MSSLPQAWASTIQDFNPPHRLNVNDISKIPLRGRKMRMPHDCPADDFIRDA
jgi:hypothetical protein